jgi:hypothetical protein
MSSSTTDEKNEYNFYKRMNEIGEYRYNNKLDSIFVFQLTFISLLLFLILYYLSTIGVISKLTLSIITITMGLFVLYIYLTRLSVFSSMRDKNTWTRMNFGDGIIVPNGYKNNGVDGGTYGSLPTKNCYSTEVCDNT